MGMIGMGNECYLYVNGISVSKPIWLTSKRTFWHFGKNAKAEKAG